MTSSLNTVQNIFKALKIITLVVFIIMIVATSCVVLSGALLSAVPDELAGEFMEIIMDEGDLEDFGIIVTLDQLSMLMYGTAVYMAGICVVLGFVNAYLKHEKQDGTPFTYRGAKELFRLGILSMAIPVGTSLISSWFVALSFMGDASFETDLTAGLMMILLSYVFRYGAELSEYQIATEAAAENAENSYGEDYESIHFNDSDFTEQI